MADDNKASQNLNDEVWSDEIITMPDVLKEEEEHEANFQAVLGGSDAKSCTYSKVS